MGRIFQPIVLAPTTVQEAMDFTALAFDLADRYRTPVIVLADGDIGQTVEAVELREYPRPPDLPPKSWAVGISAGREKNRIYSLEIEPEKLEPRNLQLVRKLAKIKENEVRWAGNC